MQCNKGKNRSKYTCELYITNWSYSNKLEIIFAMYHIMRLKGTSWAGPRHVWLLLNTVSWILYPDQNLTSDISDILFWLNIYTLSTMIRFNIYFIVTPDHVPFPAPRTTPNSVLSTIIPFFHSPLPLILCETL